MNQHAAAGAGAGGGQDPEERARQEEEWRSELAKVSLILLTSMQV